MIIHQPRTKSVQQSSVTLNVVDSTWWRKSQEFLSAQRLKHLLLACLVYRLCKFRDFFEPEIGTLQTIKYSLGVVGRNVVDLS